MRRESLVEVPQPYPWNDLTVVLVGPKERKFTIHTQTLKRIPYFRASLESGMKEAQERLVRLKDSDADAFDELIHWIYHCQFQQDLEKLVREDSGCGVQPIDKRYTMPETLRAVYSLRIKVYLLAKELVCEEVQNAAIHSIVAVSRNAGLSAAQPQTVVDKTEEGDPLRKLQMRLLSRRIHKSGGFKKWRELSRSAFRESALKTPENMEFVVMSLEDYPKLGKHPSEDPDKCQWHTHTKKDQKCRTGK